MFSPIQKTINRLKGSNQRTKGIIINILASSGLRIISILCSLLVVPMTINYVSAEQYGIWLTLSSIIAWVSYFDLGFAHGFKNRFAEAIAKGETELARRYLSTTYIMLAAIFSVVMIILSIINTQINWSSILNVDSNINGELRQTFAVLVIFFCINIVSHIFSTMMTALQKPAVASAILTGGNIVVLIALLILTRISTGTLTILAGVSSGIPCIFALIVSVIVFHTKKYSKYSPGFKYFDKSLIKNIIGMGGKFFVIMLCMLVILQLKNIIISRELGPEQVTIYNVTYKIFGIAEMVMMIILAPIWSAFTDAYTKGDFKWMQTTFKRLEKIGLICIPILLITWCLSPFIFNIWLGDTIATSLQVSAAIAFYIFCRIMGNIYMYQINGTGKVQLQLIIYVAVAIIAVPLMVYCCRQWGLVGIVTAPSLVFFLQFIVTRIQLKKIIEQRATGIWNK